eukprot:4259562-Amphidinium_carterae.1
MFERVLERNSEDGTLACRTAPRDSNHKSSRKLHSHWHIWRRRQHLLKPESLVVVLGQRGSSERNTRQSSTLHGSAVQVVTDVTLPEVYRVLTWSKEQLAIGLFPNCNHHGGPWDASGLPLAAGRVGVLSELRGDWKFQKETFGFRRHYNSDRCCHFCRASKKRKRVAMDDLDKTHVQGAHFSRTMNSSRR